MKEIEAQGTNKKENDNNFFSRSKHACPLENLQQLVLSTHLQQ